MKKEPLFTKDIKSEQEVSNLVIHKKLLFIFHVSSFFPFHFFDSSTGIHDFNQILDP